MKTNYRSGMSWWVADSLGGTMRATYCWVTLPNGERKYFSDCQLKEANAFAQTLADTSKSNIVRYDVDGGQVWFYASETTADGYRIYS